MTCMACQRQSHLEKVCQTKPGSASKNAALASEVPEKPGSEVGTFAFGAIITELEAGGLGTSDLIMELDAAGLEAPAPQSRYPLENQGFSTGAEVPVISAVVAQLTSPPARPSLSCSSQSPAQALVVKTLVPRHLPPSPRPPARPRPRLLHLSLALPGVPGAEPRCGRSNGRCQL